MALAAVLALFAPARPVLVWFVFGGLNDVPAGAMREAMLPRATGLLLELGMAADVVLVCDFG